MKLLAPPNEIALLTLRRDGVRMYCYDRPLHFKYNGYWISIPRLFLSDGFSIPRIAQGIFTKDMLGILAAILHDYLYKKDSPYGLTQTHCDELLYRFMRHYHCGQIASYLVRGAVSVAGHSSFHVRDATFFDPDKHERYIEGITEIPPNYKIQ